MPELKEGVTGPTVGGKGKCILCHQEHKTSDEDPLPPHTFPRNDDGLTRAGRQFIKSQPDRAAAYPKSEQGVFVSPLEAPRWPPDQYFKTYTTNSGRTRRHAGKYQAPPIEGYVAAPHHMVPISCINGEKGLPAVPALNPWAKRAGYDINHGGNCIFLPSSASQFYVAYYLWKVRGTGRALQGHLGDHRKVYFETVWDHLERLARLFRVARICDQTASETDKDEIARKVERALHRLEAQLFKQLAALKPKEQYRLGAQSWIEIPEEAEPFHVPPGVRENLQAAYETLPDYDHG